MELDLTAEQREFRDGLREYFAVMMTDALTSELSAGAMEGGGPEFRKAMKQMGKDGLLGLSWPKEYGGQERTALEHLRERNRTCRIRISDTAPKPNPPVHVRINHK